MDKNIYSITGESLAKRFKRQRLFRDISLTLDTGRSLSLTGPNGSGKSTLMQILAGIQQPTKGRVKYRCGGMDIPAGEAYRYMGFTSPVLNPYDELTGYENIRFASRGAAGKEGIASLLEKFQLYEHRDKSLRYYSSGMKQRLKFILAVINDPPILFLDEPGTNLDRKGKDSLYSFIDEIRDKKIIIIATNEKEEVSLCREEQNLA